MIYLQRTGIIMQKSGAVIYGLTILVEYMKFNQSGIYEICLLIVLFQEQ